MIEFVEGFVAGAAVAVIATLLSPSVRASIAKLEASHAVSKAQALIAAEEARVAGLAAAKKTVAAAAVALPTPPPNPLATGPSGGSGATGP